MKRTLVLVRHGRARMDPTDDTAMALTAAGREHFASTVTTLSRLGMRFDALFHSPVLCAVQSAKLLTPLVDGEARRSALLMRPPEADLLDLVTAPQVCMVGHRPFLAALVAWLTIGRRTHADAFELDRGGVVVLEGQPEPGRMRVKALWPCDALRVCGSQEGGRT
ncbi:MAG: histidine phosphatase family protein [Deltaproteobacteria bacterium]|nr:histidine phosphatase family protein [Deltaproteobacteria bacterium]